MTDTTAITASAAALARLEKTATKGSLADLARASRRSMLLADCSGSMNECISATGERKIDALRKLHADLIQTHPIPTAAFGIMTYSLSEPQIRLMDTGQTLPEPSGGTPIDLAIEYAHAQGANHIVLITDGIPDSEDRAFAAARAFGQPIDCFYIGNGRDAGAQFARRIADMTGGSINLTDLTNPKELKAGILGLLGDGSGI